MAINFSQQVYAHTYDTFARPVTFMPKNQPSYDGRGIYTTQKFDLDTESDAIFSDAQTVLDILESEFTTIPNQGDQLFIPAYIGIPEAGTFEILDIDTNGGGESTLAIRKILAAKP